MLVIVIPKHAEKFKFYDLTDFNGIYANETAILNKFLSFGILKYADLVVLKRRCRPHRYICILTTTYIILNCEVGT